MPPKTSGRRTGEPTPRGFVRRSKTPIAIILASVLLIAGYQVGPAIEMRWFPVYGRFTVETADAVPGGTLATFRFTKFRALRGARLGRVRRRVWSCVRQVSIRSAAGISANRPVGEAVSAPYVVGATPGDVRNQMCAEVYSDCGMPWYTRSVVYP